MEHFDSLQMRNLEFDRETLTMPELLIGLFGCKKIRFCFERSTQEKQIMLQIKVLSTYITYYRRTGPIDGVN